MNEMSNPDYQNYQKEAVDEVIPHELHIPELIDAVKGMTRLPLPDEAFASPLDVRAIRDKSELQEFIDQTGKKVGLFNGIDSRGNFQLPLTIAEVLAKNPTYQFRIVDCPEVSFTWDNLTLQADPMNDKAAEWINRIQQEPKMVKFVQDKQGEKKKEESKQLFRELKQSTSFENLMKKYTSKKD